MKTLIIGLGNPILTDDGVGVRVAYALQEQVTVTCEVTVTSDIDITEASVGGLRLMEMMVGYERVILIDACTQGGDPPGSFRRLSLPDLEAMTPTQHTASAHDTSLATALAMGRRMDLPLPEDVTIYAVRAENVIDFGDTPTPAVASAIPRVVEAILAEL
ncbi:MAG: hydrogenase maturation protease [Caldilineales bacterium]|nr:hydrogenase maturation protease [Caldilineales bacterium]